MKAAKLKKLEMLDCLVVLLSFCISAAVIMVTLIDETSQYRSIQYIALMSVLVLAYIYLLFRMATLSLLEPIKLFARIRNGLGNLKRLDTITRTWVIGILALCLLSMGFVVYVSFQNAAGVMPYAIVTGVFTVFGIVFLYVIGKKTD